MPGATTAIGGLPHLCAREAAEFSIDEFDVPMIPSLPRRSPAESSVAQALVGVPGVAHGQYGTFAVDPGRLDPLAPVATDLTGDRFVGFRTFLATAAAREWSRPVLWTFAGPLSVGLALVRAGAPPRLAFAVARAAVCAHVVELAGTVSAALPTAPQIVMLSEPLAVDAGSRDFPLPPGESVDLVSSAMAVAAPLATVGVGGAGDVDVGLLLESGPEVISVGAAGAAVDDGSALAGRLERFMRNGGWVVWGAVVTGGPIGLASRRSSRQLADTWAALAERGCSIELLRERCLLAPDGDLAGHSPVIAGRICRSVRDVAAALRSPGARSRGPGVR